MCGECGVLKATKKQLQNHERSHKTAVCPSCSKVLPLWNKHKHIKICRGQIHGPFQCDQCGKAIKTSRGLQQHRIKFHKVPSYRSGDKSCGDKSYLRVENVTLHECGYCQYKSKRRYNRDKHEEEFCKEKKKQMQGPDNALSKDEAVKWYAEANTTKTAFNSILKNISLQWGSHFLQKGVKVRKVNFGFFKNNH